MDSDTNIVWFYCQLLKFVSHIEPGPGDPDLQEPYGDQWLFSSYILKKNKFSNLLTGQD